jgi:hypothetical protein
MLFVVQVTCQIFIVVSLLQKPQHVSNIIVHALHCRFSLCKSHLFLVDPLFIS